MVLNFNTEILVFLHQQTQYNSNPKTPKAATAAHSSLGANVVGFKCTREGEG